MPLRRWLGRPDLRNDYFFRLRQCWVGKEHILGRVVKFATKANQDVRSLSKKAPGSLRARLFGEVNSIGAQTRLAQELHAKVDSYIRSLLKEGRINGRQATQLMHVYQAVRMGINENKTFANIIRWNVEELFDTHEFYVGVMPDHEQLWAEVDPVSNTQWLVVISMGMLGLLSDCALIYSEILNDRCQVEPSEFIRTNIQLLLEGEIPKQYPAESLDHVTETGMYMYFAKLFIYCHELGHILAEHEGKTFSIEAEESYCDYRGMTLYLPSAIMSVPPFSRLVRDGIIKNAEDRRIWQLKHFGALTLSAAQSDVQKLSRAFDGHSEFREFQFWNEVMWAMPPVVFYLTREIDAIVGSSDSHAPAHDRLCQFWRMQPNDEMQKIFLEKSATEARKDVCTIVLA